MDRQIPDVWNIFSLSGPNYGTKVSEESRKNQLDPGIHVNWSPRSQDLLLKWCDRSSPCDRPRTYDKFYQRTPGNFFDPVHTDSAISVCSSEEETDGPERTTAKKDKRKKKRAKDVSRTITERDVRHLERHLSMKKTIRKKIMRDLQQAFVDDPTKFHKDQVETTINLNSLNFDPKNHNPSDQKFLDLLRDSDDSGHGTPSTNEDGGTPDLTKSGTGSGSGSHGRQQKFRSVRERSKSTPRVPVVSDSSSCGGYESAESDKYRESKRQRTPDEMLRELRLESENEIRPAPEPVQNPCDDPAAPTSAKKSFWKLLTGNNKKKNSAVNK